MKKTFALVAVFVFVVSSSGVFLPAEAEAKTITVPDDYPTIQAAIDSATAGDTVFVRKGTYNERVRIEKPLSLIGENRKNTIIIGTTHPPVPTIGVYADAAISGFTIRDGEVGITVRRDKGLPPLRCNITDNILTENGEGIRSQMNVNVIISRNRIEGNYGNGISISSPNGNVSKNEIVNNGMSDLSAGISASCENLTITGNTVSNNLWGGIRLSMGPIQAYGNIVADNEKYGIQFDDYCSNAQVHDNKIMRNGVGVDLKNFALPNQTSRAGNVFWRNDLVGNSLQAFANHSWAWDRGEFLPPNNGTDVVAWDDGSVGNYWSDYGTRYPNASEVGNTGLGDTPYVIDADNMDHYPFLEPVDSAPLPTLPIAAAVIAAAALACIILFVYFRKRKPEAKQE